MIWANRIKLQLSTFYSKVVQSVWGTSALSVLYLASSVRPLCCLAWQWGCGCSQGKGACIRCYPGSPGESQWSTADLPLSVEGEKAGRGLPDDRNFRSWNRYTKGGKVLRRFPETLKHFQPGLLELLIYVCCFQIWAGFSPSDSSSKPIILVVAGVWKPWMDVWCFSSCWAVWWSCLMPWHLPRQVLPTLRRCHASGNWFVMPWMKHLDYVASFHCASHMLRQAH